jgi:hypothetical protein
VLVGIALGATLLAAPAVAISPEPDARSATLPGIGHGHTEPGDPLYYFSAPAPPHAAPPVVFGPTPQLLVAPPPSIIGGFRSRRIKVIHYATPLRVAQNDMVINLDAPGAGNAIISLELEFY